MEGEHRQTGMADDHRPLARQVVVGEPDIGQVGHVKRATVPVPPVRVLTLPNAGAVRFDEQGIADV